MPNAARLNDMVQHDNPHCHVPTHTPPSPSPPHPMAPHMIILNCAPTVMINSLMAATMTSQTEPCSKVGCVPNGPGMIMKGSAKVMINMLPAARQGDVVLHAGCIAVVPSPTGKILPPCSPNVIIGG